ncbi:MAG: ABC transporter ATP-binding protein [Firmicutes bacterium]|nr:ABC transporter ATP-binding protein [Bacillota bacterium]
MDDRIAVKLENVSKIYRIYKSNRQKVAHELLGLNRGIPLEALRDIHLEIKKGENVGILGSVGSGRSTLSGIIAGTTHPTEGKATVNGKVMPVFDLRSGFDMNFNGHDNIRIRGCMMGWTKKQIEERKQEIIEFAEMEKQMNLKMKGYKPVDRSRLGLAMTFMDDSDIIVFDSPIKVGTPAQREKCIEKMRLWSEDENRTLIMVNIIWQITEQLCERGIVLYNGEIKFDGPFEEAVEVYKEKYRVESTAGKKDSEDGPDADYADDDSADFNDF